VILYLAQGMNKLSVVVITLNEEHNIGRCLESVKNVADEIVVVDSFSTDRTEEICRLYGAQFIQHKFEGHIEQKNWALSQAHHKLVLSIDADEALSRELEESILLLKLNVACDGYYMNRLTNYCGKWIRHCGWYPDRKLRLFSSEKGKWGGMNPHDKFDFHAKSETGFLKGDLLHYSYYSVEEHYKQVEYFTTISAKAYFIEGKKSNLLKIIFSPLIKFIHGYFIKMGFLDGHYGFVICRISAKATFLKYVKLKELLKKSK
jgi:glycosyltransferase involved in cell wall biosynthesis